MAAWLSAVLLLLLAAALPAHSHDWPTRPVRLVVPYPPGGNVDSTARIIADGLQKAFGQPFVVENRAGASGMVGTRHVAKSPPDGYTLLLGTNAAILFNPLIREHAAYHWARDFAPVSSVSFSPLVLEVSTSIRPTTFAQFIALAKASPGELTMATPGVGSTNHIASEFLQQATGARWIAVHYAGNAPANAAIVGGHVHATFDQLAMALPLIRDGRVRAIAITSAKRHPMLPEVPTFLELGIGDFEQESFTGVFAPANTPRGVVDALSAALAKILGDKDVCRKLEMLGAEARASGPEEFASYLRKELAHWAPVIRDARIAAD
jgi:tripartite-type tricarboxylate transporter receptor subunit TctC